MVVVGVIAQISLFIGMIVSFFWILLYIFEIAVAIFSTFWEQVRFFEHRHQQLLDKSIFIAILVALISRVMAVFLIMLEAAIIMWIFYLAHYPLDLWVNAFGG
jgi:hypothetical protein